LFDDLNFDGRKEAIYQSSVYACYIELNTASVSELDSLIANVNYACGWDTAVGTTGCFRDYIGEQGNKNLCCCIDGRWLKLPRRKIALF